LRQCGGICMRDVRKRERKERLRREREYRRHVEGREKYRAFLTYVRGVLKMLEGWECE